MKKRRLKIILLLLGVMPFLSVHSSDIFKCRDAMGRIAFQDSPCHSAEVEEKIAITTELAADDATDVDTVAIPVKTVEAVATKKPVSAQASGKNFAWRISKGKQHGYLMGSIHFGKESMYPLPITILNAFKSADALVVEANVADADQNMLAQMMMSSGVYNDGTTLKTVLDAATWKELNVLSTSIGIPSAMIEGMRPWFASMTLTALALKNIGLDETLGIDQHFLDFAKKEHKPIRELESVKQQLAMLSGLPQKVQIAMLQQTISDVGNAKEYFDTMFKSWQSGNPQALNKIFIDDMKKNAVGEELYRLMITDRNIAMAKGVDTMLRGGCNCFVVVGAGHMGGEMGLIELLQAKGYKTEQL